METQGNFDLLEFIGGCDGSESGFGGSSTASPYHHLDDLDIDMVAEEVLRDLNIENQSENNCTSTHDYASTNASDDDGVTSCPVCDGPVGRYKYFGARVCLSCRGFFRRSVQSNQHPFFKCLQKDHVEGVAVEGKCVIDSKSRKSCRRCRFDKCLAAGMVISWVMTESERKMRISMVSKLQSGMNNKEGKYAKALAVIRQPAFDFTDAEKSFWATEFQLAIDSNIRAMTKRFSRHPDLFRSCIESSNSRVPLPPKANILWEKNDEMSLKNFMFDMAPLKTLSSYDRMALLTANYDKVFGGIYAPLCFLYYEDLLYNIREVIKFVQENRGTHHTLDAILAEVTPPSLELKHEEVDDSSYLLREHSMYDKEAAKEQTSLLARLAPSLRKCETKEFYLPQEVPIILICIVAITSTEGIELEDKDEVERVRNAHLWLLHKYLKTTYGPSSSKKLHESLMALTYWEQIVKIHRSQMAKFSSKIKL